MSDDRQASFAEKVAVIRAKFLRGVPARLEAIRDVVHSRDAPDPAEFRVRKAHRLLHDMAGSAAMLELPDIEAAVRQALKVAEAADTANAGFGPDDIATIETALRTVQALASAPSS